MPCNSDNDSCFTKNYIPLRRISTQVFSFPITKLLIFSYAYRLTPSLMVMMLIYVSLIKYMGSGPLWETYWPVKCDELWWKHMLYINNYFEVENTVMEHNIILDNRTERSSSLIKY